MPWQGHRPPVGSITRKRPRMQVAAQPTQKFFMLIEIV